MSEWREVPLGELVRCQSGFAFKSQDWTTAGVPVVKIRDVRSGVVRLDGVSFVAADTAAGAERFLLRRGDVLITMSGEIGSVGVYKRDRSALLNQRVGRFELLDSSAADLTFLAFALQDPTQKQFFESVAYGAAQPNISPSLIGRARVRVPSLATQRRIAAVLSAFDKLIEINERRIELLEDLARSLYREWFERFRFPGHGDVELVDSQMGPIPEGWEVHRLGDLAEVVSEGVSPSDLGPDEAYVGLEHLPRRQLTLREWGAAASVTSRKLHFRRGDTLFGKIRPYFHKVVWAPFDGIASSDAIVFRPFGHAGALANAVMSSDRLVAEAVATSNGTKMPRADPKALLAYPLALPGAESEVIAEFESAASGWLELAAELVLHSRHLVATRDLLLPRLITGRLDISEVDLGDLLAAEAA